MMSPLPLDVLLLAAPLIFFMMFYFIRASVDVFAA